MQHRRATYSTPPGSSSLAAFAAEVIQLSDELDVSVEALQQLVQTNKGFSATLLAVGRSRAFGAALQTTSIDTACSELGVRGIRNVAIVIALTEKLPRNAPGGNVLATCLRRAVAAQLLADNLPGRTPGRHSAAFTAGFLVEANLVLATESEVDLAVRLAEPAGFERLAPQGRLSASQQPAISARVAEGLRADSEIVHAVRHHEDSAPPAGKMSKIVWASKRIAALWEARDLTRAHFETLAAARSIGLCESALREILHTLPELVADAARVLGRHVPRLNGVTGLFGSHLETIPAQPATPELAVTRATPARLRHSSLERQLVEFRQHLLAGAG